MLIFFLGSMSFVSAQAPPPAVQIALDDLNQRLGTNLRLSDFNWEWSQQVFNNAALGCTRLQNNNLPAQSYTTYVVILLVNNIRWDYRIAETPQRLIILCSPEPTPTPPPSPTPQPAQPVTPGQIAPISPLPTATPAGCSGLTPRLVMGQSARVTPGLPNNLREEPARSARLIGEIPGEGVFTVIDGPRCTGDGTWWRVDYNGLVGWTIEGNTSGQYFVEPLNLVAAPTAVPVVLPTVTPTPAPVICNPALLPRLRIGEKGRVTPGDPNNVREQPGQSSRYVGEIPGLGVFTVLEGPRCTGDGSWWRVDYNGLVGWTIEGIGDYWIEPVLPGLEVLTTNSASRLRVLPWTNEATAPDMAIAAFVNQTTLYTTGTAGNRRWNPIDSFVTPEQLRWQSVAVAPGLGIQSILFLAGQERTLALLSDTVNWRVVVLETQSEIAILPQITDVSAAAFAPDGTRIVLAMGNGQLNVVNITPGAQDFNVLTPLQQVHDDRIEKIVFDAAGRQMVSISKKVAYLWNTATWTVQQSTVMESAFVYDAIFSPDGRWLVISSLDNPAVQSGANTGGLRFWDIPAQSVLGGSAPAGVTYSDIGFLNDGITLLVAGGSGNGAQIDANSRALVELWNLNTRINVRIVDNQAGYFKTALLNEANTLLMTANPISGVQLWAVSSGG
jgi:uncharacterized protein YraI